jgi:hypothetical protein
MMAIIILESQIHPDLDIIGSSRQQLQMMYRAPLDHWLDISVYFFIILCHYFTFEFLN